MSGELDGRVAIVTGAAGGMGGAITQAYLAAGCRVVATDLKPHQLPEAGGALSCLAHDASSESDWRSAVAEAVGRFGRIDILVNNAAYFEPAPFIDTSADDMDAHYRVNQRGVLIGMQSVLPAMRAAERGTIINICSVAALSGSTGAFAYMSTKWAIRGMSRAAARELAPFAIRVNAIMPGLIDTAMMARNPPERNAGIIGAIPAGRAGRCAEVAEAALYLASDRSAYLTGSEIVVDGGLSA
ncbi:SDR family NAD(P)-dependent oxidoreductase [Mesorhizobium sp. M2C.T.Ca.TU.002.02.1.1]|uniref:SDR family NAD(P)-dependent oxidoreductase n=1 Tax=Mesorhizobium sp. M2C.T.Ca.TU.002.02.1.1 TaxID=2496788 RepID=UPI000FCAF0F7|nr:SDR family NAD(P)-dependent oxidoreductase [Mesorhizobium sp. M2C.T.Ca.TU.002.02.1.1]RUU60939.1 SDR family oxidoreductase [Mesorhizobium sp. M2C.T.Ca.TU.002.02.1.1]